MYLYPCAIPIQACLIAGLKHILEIAHYF
jgi:hypothetical protein